MNRKISYLLVGFLLLPVACAGSGELVVDNVWSRASSATTQNAAFYLRITNNSNRDDALLGVITPACEVVELHEMTLGDDDVMRMRAVPGQRVPIPAGESVTLETGGLHVMCMGKAGEFVAGEAVELTLNFEGAGALEVMAEIREQ